MEALGNILREAMFKIVSTEANEGSENKNKIAQT